MNILIVANHYAVCSARYATAAFERLGHTVEHGGWDKGRNIWGLTLPEEYVWKQNHSSGTFGQYDLVVVMDSDPAILDSIGGDIQAGHEYPTTVVWGVDNHVRDYRRPYFDHYFLAHRNVSVMRWEYPEAIPAGYSSGMAYSADMTHIPCCYDPTLHTPSPIPFEERAYDVCMIGVMYPQRWQIVQALRDAGLKVLAGTGLVYENYAAAYQNARISLCISSNGDVAQRVMETARMGCVVMTDNCADYQLLKPNGFWLLDDLQPETVVQAVKDVLHEPEQAQVMIAQSMAWALPFSWDNGARKVVEWFNGRLL